jgi:hypothetical protein
MTNPQDDLDAVRSILQTLEHFDKEIRERILRWVMEKLGIKGNEVGLQDMSHKSDTIQAIMPVQKIHGKQHVDIKTFVAQKNPSSDTHFATTVAYFYRFVVIETESKDSISTEDLLEACRQADRSRIKYPHQTLHNAFKEGLLDKSGEKGRYKINTVGENLVAMTLPNSSTQKTNSKNPKRKKVKRLGSPKK